MRARELIFFLKPNSPASIGQSRDVAGLSEGQRLCEGSLAPLPDAKMQTLLDSKADFWQF
jgi:hypothetical protein